MILLSYLPSFKSVFTFIIGRIISIPNKLDVLLLN
jgi:hypothetical protein